MMQKKLENDPHPGTNPGTHLRVGILSKSSPMNTNMTGFRWFFQNLWVLIVFWMKVTLALEGLEKAHFGSRSSDEFSCLEI